MLEGSADAVIWICRQGGGRVLILGQRAARDLSVEPAAGSEALRPPEHRFAFLLGVQAQLLSLLSLCRHRPTQYSRFAIEPVLLFRCRSHLFS